MTLEELSDHTHNNLMNDSLSRVAAIYEAQGWSPCDALKKANEAMGPAFEAWGVLMERIEKVYEECDNYADCDDDVDGLVANQPNLAMRIQMMITCE